MHDVVTHSAADTVAEDYASGLSSGTKKLGVRKRRERKGGGCVAILPPGRRIQCRRGQ